MEGYKRPDLQMQKPAHSYTMHLVRAVYNEEIFQLYLKYEKVVHNRDRTVNDFQANYCNSVIYDE